MPSCTLVLITIVSEQSYSHQSGAYGPWLLMTWPTSTVNLNVGGMEPKEKKAT